MASNENTPESVRNAPVSKPVVVSPQRGLSRAERRKGVAQQPSGILARFAQHAELGSAGRNRPYVKPRTLDELETQLADELGEE